MQNKKPMPQNNNVNTGNNDQPETENTAPENPSLQQNTIPANPSSTQHAVEAKQRTAPAPAPLQRVTRAHAPGSQSQQRTIHPGDPCPNCGAFTTSQSACWLCPNCFCTGCD